MTDPLLPPGGGYRKLISYQKAEAVYDLTFYFCKNYLQRGDRTIDQMVQAARSGKQNIAEGSAASSTSKESEINCKHGFVKDYFLLFGIIINCACFTKLKHDGNIYKNTH